MGMRRYQCHFARCEFKIDSKSKWLEHLAVEHRLTPQEIEEISLKRKRTRIGTSNYYYHVQNFNGRWHSAKVS